MRLVALGAPQPQAHERRTRRIAVGTAAGNDLRLDEPTASRRHAARVVEGMDVVDKIRVGNHIK